MKKIVATTVLLGIAGIGVWVFKTRTPVSLSADPAPLEPLSSATPDIGSAEATPAEAEESKTAETQSNSIQRSLKAPDQRKFLILEEIFRTKNDNDPRFDTDLKELSPDLKRALREKYAATAPEKRNERGTVVFLIARSMCLPSSEQAQQVQDLEFLKSVLQEKPCLSLKDCSKDAPAPTEEEVHVAGITETTANYPQLTALRQSLECYRKAMGQTPPQKWLADQIIELLQSARGSRNQKVADEAQMILRYLGKS